MYRGCPRAKRRTTDERSRCENVGREKDGKEIARGAIFPFIELESPPGGGERGLCSVGAKPTKSNITS